jgi:hypothetical protein
MELIPPLKKMANVLELSVSRKHASKPTATDRVHYHTIANANNAS